MLQTPKQEEELTCELPDWPRSVRPQFKMAILAIAWKNVLLYTCVLTQVLEMKKTRANGLASGNLPVKLSTLWYELSGNDLCTPQPNVWRSKFPTPSCPQFKRAQGTDKTSQPCWDSLLKTH